MWLYVLLMYLLAGLGVNLGYHRILAHRALRVRKWLEHALVFLGLPAGTPVQWIGNHRVHHAHADDPEDPHSPVQRGFWYAHTGWYMSSSSVALCAAYALLGPGRLLLDAWMRPRTNQQFNHIGADVAADRWYRTLSRPLPYAAAMLLHFAVGVGIPVWLWGGAGALLAWATYAFLYNLGDSVDSLTHLAGRRLPAQANSARNNYLLGALLLGEGWHANHHWDSRCARHGWFRGQFDWTWQVIRVLRAAGLADQIHCGFRPFEKG
jgi:fatty-acid desaturase